MNIAEFDEIIEPNDQTEARREHLEKLRDIIGNVYPNKFERSNVTGEEDTITRVVAFAGLIKDKHIPHLAENEKPLDEQRDAANIELNSLRVRVAGRLAVPPRVMGKAAFVHLSDGARRLQIYVRRQDAKAINNDTGKIIDEEGKAWEIFNLLDHGDFIGVEGYLFVTKTGELSVHVETIQFLAKSMLPMPDKMHGIADPELQRRFRYADLIASSLQIEHEGLTTREVFERRAKLISGMRRFLDDNGFVEVETPILTPKATGAAAEPFETYHNALDIKLYARIAPELYLKRLMVGGFEKVYELNRNFRNEGLSHKHSPEFTMLEFYCAYMDVNGMMDFAEAMIQESVQKAAGSLQVNYTNLSPISRFDKQLERPITIDFSKFERVTMRQSIVNMLPDFIKELIGNSPESWLEEYKNIKVLHYYWYWLQNEHLNSFVIVANADKIFKRSSQKFSYEGEEREILRNKWEEINNQYENKIFSEAENAKTLLEIFESYVEENLLQPTFIIDYPKVISPLSKASPENPNVAERFELFINGMECANGFSELNDPQEQYERFRDQMKERETGDDEAMIMDEDYIRALSYGMPPAAGIGIGIDRLVMLLTNRHSIRDVILFPHMRPERRDEEKEKMGEEKSENG